jgi:hypothetical protein
MSLAVKVPRLSCPLLLAFAAPYSRNLPWRDHYPLHREIYIFLNSSKTCRDCSFISMGFFFNIIEPFQSRFIQDKDRGIETIPPDIHLLIHLEK